MIAARALDVLRRRRLHGQRIGRHDCTTPRELVSALLAVQAQDWAASKWALGLRLPPAHSSDAAIERAVDDGSIVRTHAFRWTWQLLAPDDVRWILALVRTRLLEKAARRHRELEIDAATIGKSNDAIAKALAEGRHLTRADLGEVLTRAGVAPTGQRLPHLLACAELEAIAGSGARRGKQPTWALLDERVAAGPRVDRRDALARVAERYFGSRGPATLEDLRWWTGLDTADARSALEAVKDGLASAVIDGRTHWHALDRAPAARISAGAHLLPAFDEYLVAYQNRDAIVSPEHTKLLNAGGGILNASVVIDGRVVGSWRRTLVKKGIVIEPRFFARPSAADRRAVAAASERYRAFAGGGCGAFFDGRLSNDAKPMVIPR